MRTYIPSPGKVQPKPTKKFTRDAPCTKVDLWNCFRDGLRFKPRPVVEARGEIGAPAPRYLIKKEYLTLCTVGNVEYYELTERGRHWLTDGLKEFLKHNPDRTKDCKELPPSWTARQVRIPRTR